ncbi:MAG TPA: CRISPR-associated protein Csx19 [Chloroflexota bacterium]
MSATAAAAPRRIMSLLTSLEDAGGLVFADSAALHAQLQEEAATLGEPQVWLIAWLDYTVLVGLVAAEQVQTRQAIAPQYLQELRLFGTHGEWRLWRAGEQFQARRRRDGAGDAGEVLDDDQSLWGTQAQPAGAGWTTLLEGRGIQYDLPGEVHDSDLPLRLRVRNYLGADATGLVGVTDSRLVGICNQQGEPLLGGGEQNA